jgi:carboxypeptidase T
MKRMIWATGIAILLIAGTLFGQTQTPVNLVQVQVTSRAQLIELLQLGLDIPEAPPSPEGWIQVIVTDAQLIMLEDMGYRVEELIHNMQQFYADRLAGRPMGNYRTYSEIVAAMDSIHAHYPNITTAKFSIGQSWEGRDLWTMKISDNPNVDEEEPEVYFYGDVHAREVITYTMLIYTMEHLTEGYGVDSMITRLIDTRELFITPTVNPDGLVYNEVTAPNGGGMWRKNRRNNGSSFGVDCNRNFDWRFGYDNIGSSPTPSDETYRGPYAFSEPETQAIRDFCIDHQFAIAIDYHSYQNLHMYPWSGEYDGHTPDHSDFVTIASGMSDITGYGIGCPWEVLYNVNGGSIDWFYGEQTTKNKIYGLTTEIGGIGDGFWPPANRIEPLCNENYLVNLYLLDIADQYAPAATDIRFQSYTIDDVAGNNNGVPDPGETVNMDIDLKNFGIETAPGVLGVLSESDPFATINIGSASFGDIGPNQPGSSQTPYQFTVSPACSLLHQVQFDLDVTTTEGYSTTLTLNVQIGQRETYYAVDFEAGESGWTHNAASGWTDQWHLSTQRSNSPTHSWKCGATGTADYASHMDARLESPSLPLENHAQLVFWHWMESELSGAYPDSAYDAGIVEISVDGGVWTLIEPEGGYPKTTRFTAGGGSPYTGPFAGTPCFAGTFDWQEATFDLGNISGDSLRVRLRFGSDNSVGGEGWYVDDVALKGVLPAGVLPITDLQIVRSGGIVELNWTGGGVHDGYRVYRSESSEGPFTQIWQGTATSYTDSAIADHIMYFYYVTSYTE